MQLWSEYKHLSVTWLEFKQLWVTWAEYKQLSVTWSAAMAELEEEKLREAACYGNINVVKVIIFTS